METKQQTARDMAMAIADLMQGARDAIGDDELVFAYAFEAISQMAVNVFGTEDAAIMFRSAAHDLA